MPRNMFVRTAGRLRKHASMRWDAFRHRKDPSIAQWVPVIAGARTGHLVVPSQAIASSRRQAESFVKRGLVKSGDRVLDVGAGNGRQAVGLLEEGVGEYVGLEPIKECVAYANDAFHAWENVRFDWLDVFNDLYNPDGALPPEEATFPYPDGSFDFVVAGSLYTHLVRIDVARRYVQETARVLKPAGTAFMSWFRSPPNAVSDNARRTVFPQSAIEEAVNAYFVIQGTAGGDTTEGNDQWALFLRKREV